MYLIPLTPFSRAVEVAVISVLGSAIIIYSNCPKILYTNVSNKVAYANSTNPDQTAPEEQSDQGLHCLPFR